MRVLRILIAWCLSIALTTPQSVASDDEIIIIREKSRHSRTIIAPPEAKISNDILEVSFSDSGIYTLEIKTNTGDCAYMSTLPATGDVYSYDLSSLENGYYCLTLDGPSGEYEGYFFLY